MDNWCFNDESDPDWYQAVVDPQLCIDIPVGTWTSILDVLESNGLEVCWSQMMIDIAPWIDCDGRVYPGRLVSTSKWVVVDSAGKTHGSVNQIDKRYLEYKGDNQ